MVVAKKSYETTGYAVYGNHALELERHDKYKTAKDDVRKSLKGMHIKKVKKQLKLLTLVALMFCTGILVVGRYVVIMNLGNQSRIISNDIVKEQKVNEDLKIQLMQYNDIKQIEQTAVADLGMVRPSSSSTIYIKAEESSKTSSTSDNGERKVSIITRVLEFLN